MRPLDHKLKYQIDKLLRTAVTGSLGKAGFVLAAMNASNNDLVFRLALTWKIWFAGQMLRLWFHTFTSHRLQ